MFDTQRTSRRLFAHSSIATGAFFAALSTLPPATASASAPRDAVAGAGDVSPEQETAPAAPGITVVGDGLAKTQPDISTLQLGVQYTGKSASEALTLTRQAADHVVQQLRAQGVAEGDLQTSSLSVYPMEGRGKDGTFDPTTIGGYRGNATITIQVADASRVGALLDTGMQAGASAVQSLSFDLRDDSRWRQQALVSAIDDARAKAKVVASATGLTLGGIRAVVEQATYPPRGLGGGGAGGAGEGISPGQVNVSARVVVTFDVTR